MTRWALSERRIAPHVATALLVFAAPPAMAEVNPSHEQQLIGECIAKAAKGRIWLERTLWGLRDQEGGWVGAEIANTDDSHDLGPLQVNSWWIPRIAKATKRPPAVIRYWLQHDACFNVAAARWIFLSGMTVTRDYWKAVGVYHSPTFWRQRAYAVRVAGHMKRRFGHRVLAPEGRIRSQ